MRKQTRRKWTLDEWRTHVGANCFDSYSLAVCLAALLIHEGEDATDYLSGLTGFQHSCAQQIAKKLPVMPDD